MHADKSVSIPKRVFMSKQPLKISILDIPVHRNKAAQLTLMQRNELNSGDNVERPGGVVQTQPVLTEREKKIKDRRKDAISDDNKINSAPTKKTGRSHRKFLINNGTSDNQR